MSDGNGGASVSGFWRFGAVGAMVVAALAAIAALVEYWGGANIQWFGGTLALALVAAGVGLVGWTRTAMPDAPVIDVREPLESSSEERQAFVAAFTEGEQSLTRRRLLVGSLLTIGGGLGATFLSMFRPLGPNPYPALEHTSWQQGTRLVDSNGNPLKPGDLGVGTVLTVFPEGHLDSTSAQTLLIHVEPNKLDLPKERRAWVVQGLVAYSKICTHAACPVGLYQRQQHLLLCPCHQSTFNVLDGARPTSGPAALPLPQLPLALNKDGYLVAQSDFTEPVGPGFWRRS